MSIYNTKIIRTASYIEVYEYSDAITKEVSNDIEDCSNESESKNSKESKTNEDKEQEKLQRMALTRKRAKAELVRLIDCNFDDRTSFLTLTVKENIKSREEFNKMFDKFITRFNYQFLQTKKRKLKYIAVLEQQKRGAWHAHCLLFDIGYVKHSKLLKCWGHGAVRINQLKKLDDSSNAGRYVSKYMEKAIGQELLESKGKKSYYTSRTIKKPLVQKMFIENESIKELTESENVLYKTEYKKKAFYNGKFIDSTVKYKKIKI